MTCRVNIQHFYKQNDCVEGHIDSLYCIRKSTITEKTCGLHGICNFFSDFLYIPNIHICKLLLPPIKGYFQLLCIASMDHIPVYRLSITVSCILILCNRLACCKICLITDLQFNFETFFLDAK